MAVVKTINANGSKGHHKFSLRVSEDTTSGNSSFMSYSFTIAPIQNGWDWYGFNIPYSVNIGGNTYTGSISSYNGSSTVTLSSGSNIEIPHNTDGTKSISISFSVTDSTDQNYTCGNASASDTMTLTALHKAPTINTATMTETNQAMITLGIPDTTIVPWLSQKRITLSATAYDGATLKYRIRHGFSNYALPSATTFQASNVFNTNYRSNEIEVDQNNKVNILQIVGDNKGAETTDFVLVNISGTNQKPNGIPYFKPTLEKTSTTIKRKSGGGVNLTDNKAVINVKGLIYKGSDLVGNNNSVKQLGYKIWEKGTREPTSYTSLTGTLSGNNVTVSNVIINNIDFTKVYNYKIILKDNYDYSYEIEDSVPTGEPIFTEYKDRVDFKKITVGGYNPFEYSENEIICGVWFGKPLYRKTFKIESGITSGNTSHSHEISNIDTVFINSGKSFMFNISKGKTCMLPINQYNNALTYDQVDVYADKTNINIMAQSGWGSDWVAYITLEYTKTND